jgi:uncharacterized membrane protein
MSLDEYTFLIFVTGLLAGISATILIQLVPDSVRAAQGIWRYLRAPRERPQT